MKAAYLAVCTLLVLLLNVAVTSNPTQLSPCVSAITSSGPPKLCLSKDSEETRGGSERKLRATLEVLREDGATRFKFALRFRPIRGVECKAYMQAATNGSFRYGISLSFVVASSTTVLDMAEEINTGATNGTASQASQETREEQEKRLRATLAVIHEDGITLFEFALRCCPIPGIECKAYVQAGMNGSLRYGITGSSGE